MSIPVNNIVKKRVVTDTELEHVIKMALMSKDENRACHAGLLLCCFGTGMKPSELAKLIVSDYLHEDGLIRTPSVVRAEIAFNGYERPIYWLNQLSNISHSLLVVMNSYLATRGGVGLGRNIGVPFRGLEPSAPLFVSLPATEGHPLFPQSRVPFRAEQVSMQISRLFEQAGMVKVTTQCARRSLATKLLRRGISPCFIGELLGLNSLRAIKLLCMDVRPSLHDVMHGGGQSENSVAFLY
ncbi:tyrosine-type recombinase/integrase [Aeromonas dhakensis]|uniref:tyrosine-type recombinase/integrase n=1 Tax=Aeromonas dhakensis TaxID=196024 RepID=UPI001FCC6494|nr:tyrosine-type recombinase/integrase [Aeromonas dhakensis]MCJ2367942.1 tyrosine-type recombinase/integrase [Aeromonas dhakensis]